MGKMLQAMILRDEAARKEAKEQRAFDREQAERRVAREEEDRLQRAHERQMEKEDRAHQREERAHQQEMELRDRERQEALRQEQRQEDQAQLREILDQTLHTAERRILKTLRSSGTRCPSINRWSTMQTSPIFLNLRFHISEDTYRRKLRKRPDETWTSLILHYGRPSGLKNILPGRT